MLAAATGLIPRNAPAWLAAGIGEWFQPPREALWAGVGGVHDEFQGLLSSRWRKPIPIRELADKPAAEFIANGDEQLLARAEAWALTRFLIERHFQEYLKYCGSFANDPTTNVDSVERFDAIWGNGLPGLESEWQRYLRELQSELDRRKR